ncbi:MAG: pyrroline-5-carboxylate reductase [Oceanicoccus sp.]|jgi:pyrroline-5-carboxylate reductase
MKTLKIGLIGHGHFGSALAHKIQSKTQFELIISHSRKESTTVAKNSDLILLTVRPQHVKDALIELKPYLEGKLVISFAAALPKDWLAKIVGSKTTIIRAMADIDFMQIISEENREAAELLAAVSQYPLIQTKKESDIDAMTPFLGCLPGIAAWQHHNHPNEATAWLNKWCKLTESILGIPKKVPQAIIQKVIAKGKFEKQITEVATPGGITASMLDAMNQGELNHEQVFKIGAKRIQDTADSLT